MVATQLYLTNISYHIIPIKTTATEEYSMDKLYTQSYQNLVWNVENTSNLSTYVFEYSTAYYAKIFNDTQG
jgi:hypothetical protein